MAPILPSNMDSPDQGSDEELRRPNDGGPPPITIFLDDESSGSDVEDPHHHLDGYELLTQDPEHSTAMPFSFEDQEFISRVSQVNMNMTITTMENDDFAQNINSNLGDNVPENSEISSCPPCRNESQYADKIPEPQETMDAEHIEKIKDVMKSIKLPLRNLPPWTEFISDEDLKSVLLEKLNNTMKPSCDGTSTGDVSDLPSSGSSSVVLSKDSPDAPSTSDKCTDKSNTEN